MSAIAACLISGGARAKPGVEARSEPDSRIAISDRLPVQIMTAPADARSQSMGIPPLPIAFRGDGSGLRPRNRNGLVIQGLMALALVDPQPALAVPFFDGLYGIEPEFLVAPAGIGLYPGRLELQHQMHLGRRHRQSGVNGGGKWMHQLRPFRVIEP